MFCRKKLRKAAVKCRKKLNSIRLTLAIFAAFSLALDSVSFSFANKITSSLEILSQFPLNEASKVISFAFRGQFSSPDPENQLRRPELFNFSIAQEP